MNKKRPIPEVVDASKETHTRGCECIKRYIYRRLWMNKKRPIAEVVDE
jgi:hypothetical protein